MTTRKKTVAILHPDLGIGGAEQLIVNVALSLQKRGYEVHVYTNHFDPERCLQEARDYLDVRVSGSWFPRAICGRFIALCAYIRMMLCALYVVLFAGAYDYYIIDQVSFPIPILRCRSSKVLFYCHFPDKLLSVDRKNCCKKIYRFPLDLSEELTTGCAKTILVNSLFTQGIFKASFPILQGCCRTTPQVLYPAINEKNFETSADFGKESIEDLLGKKASRIMTSLNRYERKKGIDLALRAFALHQEKTHGDEILVVAGGYDTRLEENVQHYEELRKLAVELKIEDKIVFLRSISNDQRLLLLQNTDVLLYTPQNEHFGIVPVEAMHIGVVVIACNSGGPLESISFTGGAGFLLPPNPDAWATQMTELFSGSEQAVTLRLKEMGNKGKTRVQDMFIEESFGRTLVETLSSMDGVKRA